MADVGVVMPVYKQKAEYLRAALESMLRQRYPYFRMTIVVDGAPQDVLPIIRETVKDDPRFQVFVFPNNQGVAQALNHGFNQLLKDPEIRYLTWISSDNVYYPEFLSTLRQALLTSPPHVGVVYSCFQDIDEMGKPLLDNSRLLVRRRYQLRTKEELLDFHFIGVSFMYKAAYARRIDGYRLEPVEDYDYFLRLTEHCDVRYVPDVLMAYRVNSPFSISAQLRRSNEQQRRWRYTFQLAKWEARVRRRISPELTVLFPVFASSENEVQTYENLLDQYFSNFHLVVLDGTTHQRATALLQTISDPRVRFVPMAPSLPATIGRLMPEIGTPYTLFLTPGPPLHAYFLHVLVQSLNNPHRQRHLAAFLPQNCPDSPVLYRDQPEPVEPVFFHLYRTEQLRHVLQRRLAR